MRERSGLIDRDNYNFSNIERKSSSNVLASLQDELMESHAIVNAIEFRFVRKNSEGRGSGSRFQRRRGKNNRPITKSR